MISFSLLLFCFVKTRLGQTTALKKVKVSAAPLLSLPLSLEPFVDFGIL